MPSRVTDTFLLPAISADDSSLVEQVCLLVNRAYTVAEAGMWRTVVERTRVPRLPRRCGTGKWQLPMRKTILSEPFAAGSLTNTRAGLVRSPLIAHTGGAELAANSFALLRNRQELQGRR